MNTPSNMGYSIGRKRRLIHAAIGVTSLLVGVAFYTSMRPVQTWIAWAPRLPEIALPANVAGSAPCFLHVVAFALLQSALTTRCRSAVTLWTMIALAWEALQGLSPSLGTCDPWDFAACMAGAYFSLFVGRILPLGNVAERCGLWLKLPLYLTGASALMATSYAGARFEPIYLSYADLRNAFRVEPPQAIRVPGKILTADPYLFISEPNRGIHVFDNQDPTQPKPIAFLNLPGNVDLAAKEDVLYADSYIDLVAIQFSDGNFTLTHREEAVFPYDPYQYLGRKRDLSTPDEVQFGSTVDKTQGVVVGAKKTKP